MEGDAANQLFLIAFRNDLIAAFFKDLTDCFITVCIKVFFPGRPLEFHQQESTSPTIFDSEIQPARARFII